MTTPLQTALTAARDALTDLLTVVFDSEYSVFRAEALAALALLDAELARPEPDEDVTLRERDYWTAPPVVALDGTPLGPPISEAELPDTVDGLYWQIKGTTNGDWNGPLLGHARMPKLSSYLYARPVASNAPAAVPPGSPAQGSKTPRTEALHDGFIAKGSEWSLDDIVDVYDLARALETELAASLEANQREYSELETSSRLEWEKLTAERDDLRKQNVALVGALDKTLETLRFFRSAIQCGEAWTDTCRAKYDQAVAASKEARP